MEGQELRFKIIGMLKEVETAASELYGIYAENFPEHRDFWAELSKEERDHAGILHSMGAEVAHGGAVFNADKFNVEQIQQTLDWAKERIAVARKGEITLEGALSDALELEESLVEKEYYGIFEGTSKDIKHFLDHLYNACKDHRGRVRKLLEKEKGG